MARLRAMTEGLATVDEVFVVGSHAILLHPSTASRSRRPIAFGDRSSTPFARANGEETSPYAPRNTVRTKAR